MPHAVAPSPASSFWKLPKRVSSSRTSCWQRSSSHCRKGVSGNKQQQQQPCQRDGGAATEASLKLAAARPHHWQAAQHQEPGLVESKPAKAQPNSSSSGRSGLGSGSSSRGGSSSGRSGLGSGSSSSSGRSGLGSGSSSRGGSSSHDVGETQQHHHHPDGVSSGHSVASRGQLNVDPVAHLSSSRSLPRLTAAATTPNSQQPQLDHSPNGPHKRQNSPSPCPCCLRRALLASLAATSAAGTAADVASGFLPYGTGSFGMLSPQAALGIGMIPQDPSPTLGLAQFVLADRLLQSGPATWQQRAFAAVMAESMAEYEASVAEIKRRLFSTTLGNLNPQPPSPTLKLNSVAGDIFSKTSAGADVASGGLSAAPLLVELGVGTGPNFGYYAQLLNSQRGQSSPLRIVGVDPNSAMQSFAEASAISAGFSNDQFRFLRGVGEELPLADNVADIIVGTLVLCSVADVAACVKEVARVLKPGGRFVFIEHIAANDGSLLGFWQSVLDPLQQLLADGCHLRRDPSEVIEMEFGTVNLERVMVPGLSLLAPHIFGFGVKQVA